MNEMQLLGTKMNNPQNQQNAPFVYDPTVYDNSILNGIPSTNAMGVDTNPTLNPNQNSTMANFAAAYPYGFPNFGDQLNFPNFPYFANQNSTNYIPIPTTFPSTSVPIPTSIQSANLYPQQNAVNLTKQSTTTTSNEGLRSTLTNSTRSGVNKLLTRREKPKRKRILFTADQIRIMEEHFKHTQFTQHTERLKLSQLIGLTPQQIKIWYQNRRYKEKLTVRRPGDPVISTPRRSNKSSPNQLNLSGQSVKIDEEVKLEFKQEMDNQIMAMQNATPTNTDYFPSIYSNWPQANQQPSPFFPFNAEMYANGLPGQQLNNSVNYPQMFHNFNTQTGFNPLAYYNSSNGPSNPN